MLNDISDLLGDWRHYLLRPDVLWQAGVLLLCLGLAWLAARMVRSRIAHGAPVSAEGPWRFGQGGLKRITFPLVGLLLVLLARTLLRQSIHVDLLSLAIPLLGSLAMIRVVFYVLRYTFGHSAWLSPFERIFAMLVWSVVALHILGLLPGLIEMLEDIGFSIGRQKLNMWLLLQATFMVLTTLLLSLWLSSVVEARLLAAETLDANLRVVFSRLSRVLLMLLAVLIGLPLVGIDLTTLSVFSGALGVGIGFGLQRIASNYVAGFTLLLDRSIRIGNLISVGPDRGLVSKITTRYTVIRNLSGIEAIIPNEMLVSSVVRNESYTDTNVRLSLPMQVAYGSDLDQAMHIMVAAARAQPRVLADPPPAAFVMAFADSGINLELGFWIADSQEGVQQLRSDLNLAIWRAFQQAGIVIPCPQREVRMIVD
ncbi:MAG: mechanosensitive ion channel [Betaproteobacteria bacterium]|nr:mechanosensitive ion channel [Betaproteobacteria bacterium]